MARIASIVEIQPVTAQRVAVVAGDFNINVHAADKQPDVWDFFGKKKSKKATTLTGSAYQQLKNIGFTQLFGTTTPGTNGVTFLVPIDNATPTGYLTQLGLDNIFLRYDGGLQPPNVNPRIINPVTGTDEFAADMLQSLASINTYYNNNPDRIAAFRKDYNYGHIAHFRGVSDHLPLVVDI